MSAATPSGNRKPLRVLAVIDKLGYEHRLHGPGRLWLSTLPAFDPAACVIIPCVLRLDPQLEGKFAERGVRLRNLRKGRLNPLTLIDLCRLIREERIDVLHLHGDGASTFGRLAAALTGVPAIVHYHDLADHLPWYVGCMDRLLAPLTAQALAISDAVAAACRTRRFMPNDKVAVVRNAVEPRWSDQASAAVARPVRGSLGIPVDVCVIGTVTRFRWEKDVPTMIAALARLGAKNPGWRAIIVGDGPDRPLVDQAIADSGVGDKMHVLGFQEDVQAYLAIMDIAVFSSVSEGFGLALLEAMAEGLAVVATAVGGISELVRDGHNGLLVPPRNPDAMAGAIQRLMSDRALAKRLGDQARLDAALFRVPGHVAQMTAFYRRVADQGRARRRPAGT